MGGGGFMGYITDQGGYEKGLSNQFMAENATKGAWNGKGEI